MKIRRMLLAVAVVAAATTGFVLLHALGKVEQVRESADDTTAVVSPAAFSPTGAVAAVVSEDVGGTERGDAEEPEESDEPKTEEEKAAVAEEAKVEAFDDLTDRWLEPSKAGVSMKDIDDFTAAFRQVPKDRQDECIHRALNLIPDDNVMLLAGVLMDKTAEKEIVETVFNDVLNRDEDVKKPILQQIFKDKTHPCWADTAWILDVTGELPAKRAP